MNAPNPHRVSRAVFAGLLLSAAIAPTGSAAQDGWNAPRTVEIVDAAIDSRQARRGSELARFSAYAEGQVHYLAEYAGEARDQVIRSDRIALELRWRRGVGSLQTIVGRRHVSWMPTTIEYHIDHLSLVVENFGDRIYIGDGDEVRDVLHPVAPGALGHYEYRLVDSLGIRVNDGLTELYRLEVRPVASDSPGVVGTIDVERESLALVRMAGTFTPASYVDPTVRSVTVDLQNALIGSRAWLPAEQHTEVRRQMRFLDLPFGGTIRTRFKVLSWDLDPPTDTWVPTGHRVRAVPKRDLAVYAGWRTMDPAGDPERLSADSALFERIRSEAVQVVGGRFLGGTGRLRLDVPSFSSLFRVRRAEGAFFGLGARYDVDGRWSVGGHGGYAAGAGKGEAHARVTGRFGRLRVGLEGWVERPADIGPWSAASGLISTGGAVLRGEDFLDPFFETGGALRFTLPAAGGTASLALSTARHESARLHLDPLGDAAPRPVVPVRPGRDTKMILGFDRQLPPIRGSRLHAGLVVELAASGTFDYTRWVADLVAVPSEPDAVWRWEGRGGVGVVTGNAPIQRTLRFGGRGTVPGYEFRRFNGEQVAFVHAAVSRSVLPRVVRLRALAALGWSNVGDGAYPATTAEGALRELVLTDSEGFRPAVGAGVSLIDDLVRIDAARGLRDGVWEWTLSVNPQFRAPL